MTDTGHTSAHLTMVTDARITELVKQFGRNHAQAVWDAGLAAIATIDDVVRDHAIDAGFGWVDGYLHAPLIDEATHEVEPSAGGCAARERSGIRCGIRRGRATRQRAGHPVRGSGTHSTRAATWRALPRRLWHWEGAFTSTHQSMNSAMSRARSR